MPIPRRSFPDAFAATGRPADEVALLRTKAAFLHALSDHVGGFATQGEAAEALGVARPRISEIVNGRLSKFSLDLLVKLASRAGLRVEVEAALYAEA